MRHHDQVEQVMSEEKRMTKTNVIRRGEEMFVKIQKLVHKNFNQQHAGVKLEMWSLLEQPEPLSTMCTRAPMQNPEPMCTGATRTFFHYVY